MAFLPADGRGSRPEGMQIGILSHIVNRRKHGCFALRWDAAIRMRSTWSGTS